ncbi:MAG: hypothetical protein ACYC5V_01210 [Gemmatimonadaceae bacterium]
MHAPISSDDIVDIEALLLGSLGLASRVPRLLTLATDWTLENSQLLSIARLRALLAGPFKQAGVDIGELAQRVATEGGDARWRALATAGSISNNAKDRSAPSSRKAMPPRWRGAESLLLQLRRGFGVGVKPDLLAILLGARGAWMDAAQLADLSAYTVSAVRRAADDMASARFIESSGGHSRAFRADVGAWSSLLPSIGDPLWRRRTDGFAFVRRWLHHAEQKAEHPVSELALSISFGALMTDYWPLWLEAGVTQQPVSDNLTSPWVSRHAAIESLVAWFGGDK